MDLCQRAHHTGWEVWYTPQSRVVHPEASSGIVKHIVKRRPTFWFQARRRYFLKNEGALKTLAINTAFIVGFALWRIRRSLQQKPDFDPPSMLFDFIRQSSLIQGTKISPVTNPSTMNQKTHINQFAIEHLLVLPVPFRQQGDELLIEAQAHHGLHRWLDSFETLALAAAVIPEYLAIERREVQWIRPDPVILERVKFVPLPWAYRPDIFVRHLPATIGILASLIDKSRYLQFGIGALWGDWAAVGAEIAIRKHRKFAIHTDRVEHEVILRVSKDQKKQGRKLRVRMESSLMKTWHKRIIQKCDLGLFHGMDTYQAYRPWMKDVKRGFAVHNIHDIHDEGMDDATDAKYFPTEIESVGCLRILYAGRIAPEKAPEDWLKALGKLSEIGVEFQAVWAGDGPLRDTFIRHLCDNNLSGLVNAPGFISDRSQIAQLYRQADLFVFTHITPESPRCLLEALKFGVPIVGYDSAFARDLISRHGGGVLFPCGDWEALAHGVATLVADRDQLMSLKEKAARDGKCFTSQAVFSERSKLIKKYLTI